MDAYGADYTYTFTSESEATQPSSPAQFSPKTFFVPGTEPLTAMYSINTDLTQQAQVQPGTPDQDEYHHDTEFNDWAAVTLPNEEYDGGGNREELGVGCYSTAELDGAAYATDDYGALSAAGSNGHFPFGHYMDSCDLSMISLFAPAAPALVQHIPVPPEHRSSYSELSANIAFFNVAMEQQPDAQGDSGMPANYPYPSLIPEIQPEPDLESGTAVSAFQSHFETQFQVQAQVQASTQGGNYHHHHHHRHRRLQSSSDSRQLAAPPHIIIPPPPPDISSAPSPLAYNWTPTPIPTPPGSAPLPLEHLPPVHPTSSPAGSISSSSPSLSPSPASSYGPPTPPTPPTHTSRFHSLPPLPEARARPRPPNLACYFCRERKIACGRPAEGSLDQTCNQCRRRGNPCHYPETSLRGQHRRGKGKKQRSGSGSGSGGGGPAFGGDGGYEHLVGKAR
ncbi:hypothetical protein D9615_009425 [Tricholomella constricta]|uniref:Zn(2)-C6 fungal-type domain-containing protein n=1 Tax=Tricholomella constricta TaxID=117010 RepID=A0A8H5GYU7_9AGAR|nr:hypothetical protein D9615_009425 [Tricholomella constricta]